MQRGSDSSAEPLRRLHALRWLVIVAPAVAVLAVDALTGVLETRGPRLDEWRSHGLSGVLLILLIVPFSFLVFGLFDRIYAAVAARNEALAALQEHTARQSDQMRALDEAGLALVSDLSVQAVLQRVVHLSRELVHARSARLRVSDDHSGGLRPVYSGDAVVFEFEQDEARSLRVPIAYKDRAIGDLIVSDRESGEFTPEDRTLLGLFAAHAAVAIENARLYGEVTAYAVVEERARISREMHDSFAQVLGYVSTKAQAAQEFLAAGQDAEAVAQLGQLQAAARELYMDVREAIFSLRSVDASGRGLDGDLESYARQFMQYSGVDTRFEAEGELLGARCGPMVEAHLMRIVQEALTNVRKHARASHAWVTLAARGGLLCVTIRDDGVGFEAGSEQNGSRFGLRTMRERADLIGATLLIDSTPGAGTRLEVCVPCSGTPSGVLYARTGR